MVKNCSQRIDIAAPAHFALLAGRLLRRKEVGRAEHLPGAREGGFTVQALGQAEVRDAWLVRGGVNQYVRGLKIAMQNPLSVSVMDGFGDRLHITCRFGGRQWTVPHEL